MPAKLLQALPISLLGMFAVGAAVFLATQLTGIRESAATVSNLAQIRLDVETMYTRVLADDSGNGRGALDKQYGQTMELVDSTCGAVAHAIGAEYADFHFSGIGSRITRMHELLGEVLDGTRSPGAPEVVSAYQDFTRDGAVLMKTVADDSQARSTLLEQRVTYGIAFLTAMTVLFAIVWRWSDARARSAQALARETQEALRFQQLEQAKLSSLAESMSAGLILIDVTGTVSYCNGQVGEFLDCVSTELTGRKETELEKLLQAKAADPAEAAVGYRGLAASTEAWSVRVLVVNAPSRKTLRCSMFPVRDGHGLALGRGLLISDVTREAELDELKDDFIGVASHELRTPLTGIRGFAELLRDGLPADSRHWAWASRISQEAERMTALVSDLLEATSLDAGTVTIREELLGLHPLLQEAQARVAAVHADRDVRLHGDHTLEVATDPEKLMQVVMNLLDNALKYSPAGTPVEVRWEGKGPWLEISVADEGPGIPADKLGFIFEKFQRLESTDPSLRGSGLGLYITRQLAEHMGGSVTVRSELGTGSTFTVAIPAQAQARGAAA